MAVTAEMLTLFITAFNGHAQVGDWKTYSDAPAQPQMSDPGATRVFAEPEVGVPGSVTIRTLDQIVLADDGQRTAQEVTSWGSHSPRPRPPLC